MTVAAALSALRGRRALLVGDLILDTYLYGETVRVSREAPVLVVRKEREEMRLGGAANTAANLAALGVHTTMVGLAGTDRHGDALLHHLHAAGVRTELVRREGATTAKTRILAGAFGTSRQQVLRLDDEAAAVSGERSAELRALVQEHAGAADVVVVSDYGYGLVDGPMIAVLLGLARAGTTVCVDSRFQLHRFRGVAAVTPNVPEAEGVVGYPLHDRESVERAGQDLLVRCEAQCVLLTRGRHGMACFTPGGAPLHVPIVGSEEVTDVTGAGDTVIATFAAALAANLGQANATRLANCAAGIVVAKAGTAVARPEEIERMAAHYGVEVEPWAS